MQGIVAAGSQYTAEAGAQMLRQGGNAVDATVAATFASFTAEPSISTLGGGGFAIVYRPGRNTVLYDFFCAAPGLGREAQPENLDFRPITVIYESTTGVYHIGRGSSAVPGNLSGLCLMHEEAGSLPLRTVLEPAIQLAREGVVLTENREYVFELVDQILVDDPSSRAIYAPEGVLLGTGDRFVNPAFAVTLERIADDGWQSFYTGALAETLVADQKAQGGLITAEDLAAYRTVKREPLRFHYRGYTVYTNPPPAAGGILIAYAMRLLGRVDLSCYTHGDADHITLLVEATRQANIFRQRNRPAMLTEAGAWTALLGDGNLDAVYDNMMRAVAGDLPPARKGDSAGPSSTTHISAMDETGLAVGVTNTSGETGGYALGETGIVMNNILGEADLNPDGFHRWPPGARLASMMSPTIVTDESGARLVTGSGGAARLRGAIMQVLSNAIDWHMDVGAAARKPRVHFEDSILDLEGGYSPAAADALEERGYSVRRWEGLNFYFGGAHTVLRHQDGRLYGGGDPRRDGAVVVVE